MGHAVVTPTGERGRAPQGSGPLLFARFAHAAAVGEQAAASAPPGGDVHGALLGTYLARGVVDGRLAEVESEFAGAWPYLEVIAEATGIDRLDRRVVEAYWIGNPLVEQVPPAALHRMLSAWARTVGVPSPEVVDAVATFGVAHHSCHVLCVLPWSRLAADEPARRRHLIALDGCRVRWARVRSVDGDLATVRVRPLEWHGRLLGFGDPRDERVQAAVDGHAVVADLRAGEWVAVHWGRVCERLTDRQVRRLFSYTVRALRLVPELAHPPVSHPDSESGCPSGDGQADSESGCDRAVGR